MSTSVRQSIVVAAPPERAFEVFTARIGSWWPPDHVLGEPPAQRTEIELRPGGRAFSVDATGAECQWGHVLELDPPRRVLLSWDVTAQWQPAPEGAATSEIEVTFEPEGDGTRVTLEHRHLDRHGEGWEAMRDSVGSDDGWAQHLRRLAAVL
jgi:uncharacterized protein YndB with AHSA1/START domain